MNTAVIGTDVVERQVIDGVLHTHRLVSSRWYFPTWAHRVSFNKLSRDATEITRHEFIDYHARFTCHLLISAQLATLDLCVINLTNLIPSL